MRRLADSRLVRFGAPLLFAVLALAAWQLYCELSGVSESSLPRPTQVVEALWEQWGSLELGHNAWVTIREILLGYGLAIVLGICLAVAIRSSPLDAGTMNSCDASPPIGPLSASTGRKFKPQRAKIRQ